MPEQRDPRGGHARYGRSGAGGGHQDQGERKDEAWRSRQGGSQAQPEGRRGQPEAAARPSRPSPPLGTNTQGEMPGIDAASREALERLEQQREPDGAEAGRASDEARAAAGMNPPGRRASSR